MSKNVSRVDKKTEKFKAFETMKKEFIAMGLSTLKSDKIAHALFLLADTLGLLDHPLTPKQRMAFSLIPKCYDRLKNFSFVSSGDFGTNRIKRILTTGHHRLPLQQSSDTSRLVNKLRLDYLIAVKMHAAKLRQTDPERDAVLIPYMLTLTLPNARKGTLKKAVDELLVAFGRFQTALRDGARRQNGLRVIAVDGSTDKVLYCGGLRAMEIAIQGGRLLNKQKSNLYNQHIHFLMLTDGLIDVEKTEQAFFEKWQSINPQYKLSRKAFDLRMAYGGEGETTDEIVWNALKELLKYEIKPQIYQAFEKDHTSRFAVEVFAELQNALHGRVSKQRYGILQEAGSFNKEFESFNAAMLSTDYSSFADVVTKESNFVRKGNTKGFNLVTRQLKDDEVLFYNAGMLESVLVSEESLSMLRTIETFVDDPDEKIRIEVLQDFKYKTSPEEFLESLRLYSEDKEHFHFDKDRRKMVPSKQQAGVKVLYEALLNKIEVGGTRYHDWLTVKNYSKADCEKMLNDLKSVFAEMYPPESRTLKDEEAFEKSVGFLRLDTSRMSDHKRIKLTIDEVDAGFFMKHFPKAYENYRAYRDDLDEQERELEESRRAEKFGGYDNLCHMFVRC